MLPLGTLVPCSYGGLNRRGFLHVFPQIFDCEGFVARLKKPRRSNATGAGLQKSENFLLRRLKAGKPQRFPPPRPPSDYTGMTMAYALAA